MSLHEPAWPTLSRSSSGTPTSATCGNWPPLASRSSLPCGSSGEPAPRPTWDPFVVKPSISAGARLSARYRPGRDIEGHIRRIHATGAAAMVQPYMWSIDTDWETGTYVFGGEVSHAIRKGPVLESEEGPVDDMSKALLQPVKPLTVDPQLADFALRVVQAAPPLLYARVDTTVSQDGELLLLELEATEPFLFLDHAPAAADCFAGAVARWLERPSPPPRTDR